MNRTTAIAGILLAATTALGCISHRPPLPPAPEGPAGSVAGIYVYSMPHRCRSRMDCSGSDDCVWPEGAIERQGVCGIPIDAEGRQAGLNVRRVPQCGVPSDCPANFTCMKFSMQDGMCIR